MKHLLLLHGAAGSKEQLNALTNLLQEHFHVYSINFSGHGGQSPLHPFSIPDFAGQVLQWMNDNELERISVFGYSMGGYVGAYLAKAHPERIERLITLGTKWHWNETIAAKEIALLHPLTIEQKVPKFAEALCKLHHADNWKTVLQYTAAMLHDMGAANPLSIEDFATIHNPVLLLLGDSDKMVTMDETVAVFKALPAAQLGVLPGTPHPIERVNPGVLVLLIKNFLASANS